MGLNPVNIAENSIADIQAQVRQKNQEAAGKTGNLKELYFQLAAHIDSDEERKSFLASLPR